MDSFLLFSWETWILILALVVLLVVYGYKDYGVFERLGIPCPKPRIYLGTVGRYSDVYYLDDMANSRVFGRVWGMYELKKPVLVVMEPDMLKTILVKECFTYFTNRRNLRLNGELYDSLSFAEDDNWRRIRHHVTPSFTTRRIKEMFGIMKQHSCTLTAYLRSKVRNDEAIDVKSIFGGYVLDVMAGCALGLDLDSINNPSAPFRTHASNFLNISIPFFIFQGCFPVFVPLFELLGFSIFSKSSADYLRAILEKARQERKRSSHKAVRDWLQDMMDSQTAGGSRRGKTSEGLSDHEITSQLIVFVFAGFETSALTFTFLAYNLARNPEAMRRLQEEIDSTFPDRGSVQYHALMQMQYLDSVVDETLRLHPPLPRLERTAKETVVLNGITIPKGMGVMVPVYALHRDPLLWEEPEEFRPERVSVENKRRIQPYSYLPFGAGPRNCVGMRLALVMIKLGLVEILQNYSFTVCEETQIPLQMGPQSLVAPLKPVKLKVVARS